MSNADLLDTADDTYEAWYHDFWSGMRLEFDRVGCVWHGSWLNDGSWYDNGNELNEVFWSSAANYQGSSGSWGMESTDHEACFFWGDGEYLATDIDVDAGQGPIFAAQSDSMEDCLSNDALLADVMLHEVGHSYGIKHNDAWLTTMNSFSSKELRRCCPGDGWRLKPWSDETQAMMAMYGWSNWNTVVDVSGSFGYGAPSNRLHAEGTSSVCPSAGWTSITPTGPQSLGFTYGNHYGNAGGITYRYLLLPDTYSGSNPLANAVASSPAMSIPSAWTFPGAAYTKSGETLTFWAGLLSAGQTYRVWVRLTPAGSGVSEISTGDNIFPLRYFIQANAC